MSRLLLAGVVLVPLAVAVAFAVLVDLVGRALVQIDNALTIEDGMLG